MLERWRAGWTRHGWRIQRGSTRVLVQGRGKGTPSQVPQPTQEVDIHGSWGTWLLYLAPCGGLSNPVQSHLRHYGATSIRRWPFKHLDFYVDQDLAPEIQSTHPSTYPWYFILLKWRWSMIISWHAVPSNVPGFDGTCSPQPGRCSLQWGSPDKSPPTGQTEGRRCFQLFSLSWQNSCCLIWGKEEIFCKGH